MSLFGTFYYAKCEGRKNLQITFPSKCIKELEVNCVVCEQKYHKIQKCNNREHLSNSP